MIESRSACDVAIVGAGAAGLAAAVFARRAERSAERSARASRYILIDGARRPGAKILVSGGSRCNVTNARVTERDFWGGRATAIRQVLRALPVAETVAFFREIGVTLHEEADGKLIPDSNRARDVLNALLAECERLGVTLVTDHRVTAIDRTDAGFTIHTSKGDLRAKTVVLATGGLSLPKSGSDGGGIAIARALGHSSIPTTPALDPLVLSADDRLHAELSGVSHDAEIAVWVDGAIAIRLRGSLLWTHTGVSGPVALNASRHWLRARLDRSDVRATLSFVPGMTLEAMDAELVARTRAHPRMSVQTTLGSAMPSSVAAVILRELGIGGTTVLAHLARDDRRALSRALVEWPLPVTGSRGYQHAEATAGGIPLSEIDTRTMASRVCPGLFLVGEMLDVDGRLGGFNFQWAWASAFVAGRAIANGAARSLD